MLWATPKQEHFGGENLGALFAWTGETKITAQDFIDLTYYQC